jgi:hypothetical protein
MVLYYNNVNKGESRPVREARSVRVHRAISRRDIVRELRQRVEETRRRNRQRIEKNRR